jgi:L-lactate dehydrogenase (cytochrome)
MYSVAALGNEGGNHIISILKTQLKQVMEQVCCETPADLYKHLLTGQYFPGTIA